MRVAAVNSFARVLNPHEGYNFVSLSLSHIVGLWQTKCGIIWAWASRCTTYSCICTGFLITWVQWVMSKGRNSIRTWKRWRPSTRVTGMQSWWLTTVGIWWETVMLLNIPGVQALKLNNDEATCNLRIRSFINAHHSVYSNQFFYQVINICCWQNIFSLKKHI